MSNNILEINNNFVPGATYKLRILNGENISVDNAGGDLMSAGAWNKFLAFSDYITIPIKSIGSLVRSQSIWYRNKPVNDYISITLSNDYNSNIIEFLNRGIKNASLDFDSIEQLIFSIEVDYLNTVGGDSSRPLFVGRPEITKYSTDGLQIKVNAMVDLLKYSDFESNVLKTPTSAYYNFISLQSAFERIVNDPHNTDDSYRYPVAPFNLNEETYLIDEDGYELVNIDTLPDGYEIYAEDYVLGATNRYQQFYYRDSPECGIVDITLDANGNYQSFESTNLSEFNYFVGGSQAGSYWTIKNNIFRLFRPVKSFIAPADNTNMQVARLNSATLEFIPATNDEYMIHEGDEIIVLEQLIEIMRGEDYNILAELVFFDASSNVFYYNRTQNIMYWKYIAAQVNSIPFPSQWLDLRLSGYFNVPIRANSSYLSDFTGNITYNKIFTQVPFLILDGDNEPITSYYTSKWKLTEFNYVIKGYCSYISRPFSVLGTSSLGVDDEPHESIALRLSYISQIKPKTIRVNDDYNLVFCYLDNFGVSGSYNFNLCEMAWNRNEFKDLYNVVYSTTATAYITSIPYFINSNCIFTSTFIDILGIGPCYVHFPNISTSLTVSGLNYQVSNFSQSSEGYSTRFFIDNVLYVYDGSSAPYEAEITLSSGSIILDVNRDLDTITYRDSSGYLQYETLTTHETIFTSDYAINTLYFLSMDRSRLFYTMTEVNNQFSNMQFYVNNLVRLLQFDGSRFNCMVGLANSFFKNMYVDNYGITQIGWPTVGSFNITDNMIENFTIQDQKKYNKIEWSKYTVAKNEFTEIDNDVATNEITDDTDYDESFSINIYANVDVDMTVSLSRSGTTLNYVCSNEFGTVTGSITPTSFSSFSIDLTDADVDTFTGIILYVNFYDAELEDSKSFSGKIERRELVADGVKDLIVSTNKSFVFVDDKALGLKFPFLQTKYSEKFMAVMEDYWVDSEGDIRKIIECEIEIPELLIFDDNYQIFNVGKQRVIIDSEMFYINGYALAFDTDLVKFTDNRATFFIEQAVLNFKTHKTTLKLVSI